MDLETAIRQRRSIRKYLDRDVPKETIEALIEMARWAPSAGNYQSRDFVVVRDRATRARLAHIALDQTCVAEAPVVLVVAANLTRAQPYGERGQQLYAVQDADAATQNFLLAAHAKGLGTVWVGAFDERQVAELLGLPGHVRPTALIPLGYPAEQPNPPVLLPAADCVHWERW